jgi:hypothetical protein
VTTKTFFSAKLLNIKLIKNFIIFPESTRT